MRCPMCLAVTDAATRPPGADPYRGCPACGGVFLDPYPAVQSNTAFETTGGASRQAELEAGRRRYFLRQLLRLEHRMDGTVQGWRLLEIGCGSGVMLKLAWERGWRADAVELSPELAQVAQVQCPDAHVTCGDATALDAGRGDYDAVVALDVLEHVLDPDRLLRNCGAQLRRGGLLLVQTPNARGLRHRLERAGWDMRDPVQHVNLYSPRGLVGALERAGFAVESLETASGTGLETGWRLAASRLREAALNPGRLGNALVAVARRL